MAFTPQGQGSRNDARYPVPVGDKYKYWGEQPGWIYDPYTDTYRRNPQEAQQFYESQGLIEPEPSPPGLGEQLLPIGATAAALYGGKELAELLFDGSLFSSGGGAGSGVGAAGAGAGTGAAGAGSGAISFGGTSGLGAQGALEAGGQFGGGAGAGVGGAAPASGVTLGSLGAGLAAASAPMVIGPILQAGVEAVFGNKQVPKTLEENLGSTALEAQIPGFMKMDRATQEGILNKANELGILRDTYRGEDKDANLLATQLFQGAAASEPYKYYGEKSPFSGVNYDPSRPGGAMSTVELADAVDRYRETGGVDYGRGLSMDERKTKGFRDRYAQAKATFEQLSRDRDKIEEFNRYIAGLQSANPAPLQGVPEFAPDYSVVKAPRGLM